MDCLCGLWEFCQDGCPNAFGCFNHLASVYLGWTRLAVEGVLTFDGRRIEANPSCPMQAVAKFADAPAPEPPDEPPAVRSRS